MTHTETEARPVIYRSLQEHTAQIPSASVIITWVIPLARYRTQGPSVGKQPYLHATMYLVSWGQTQHPCQACLL
jgi:hypothetical protein